MSEEPSITLTESFDKDKLTRVIGLHLNLQENMFVVTEDKVRLRLMEHLVKISKRREWLPLVALFATLLVALMTTQFRDAFYLPAGTWRGAFLLGCIVAGVYTIISVVNAWRVRASVDTLMEEIKKGATAVRAEKGTLREGPGGTDDSAE